MLATAVLMLALAATGLADVPAGYKKVYITSNVNTKFVIVPKAASKGSQLVVQSRTDKADQQWYVKEGAGGKIQLADTTLCMDAGPKTAWKDMANVYVQECADSDQQKWTVMADGRIALDASSPQECLDLQLMRAVANQPVGLYSCKGLGNTGAADKGINWPLAAAT